MAIGDYTQVGWTNNVTAANSTNLGNMDDKIKEIDTWATGIGGSAYVETTHADTSLTTEYTLTTGNYSSYDDGMIVPVIIDSDCKTTKNTETSMTSSTTNMSSMHKGTYDNKLYFVGPSAASYNVAWYDIDTDTWDESTGTAPSGYCYPGVIVGSKIYAIRQSTGDLYIYDIITNTWDETTGANPSSATDEGGYYYDGKIYWATGSAPYRFFAYDIATNTWDETLAIGYSLPTSRPLYGVGDKYYARDTNGPIAIYDITNDIWEYNHIYAGTINEDQSTSDGNSIYFGMTNGSLATLGDNKIVTVNNTYHFTAAKIQYLNGAIYYYYSTALDKFEFETNYPTINVDGLGAKSIDTYNLKADSKYNFIYDATDDEFKVYEPIKVV